MVNVIEAGLIYKYQKMHSNTKDIGDLLGIKNIKDTINGMDDQCKIPTAA